MKNLILLGAGGHCLSCIDVIRATGKFNIVGILGVASEVGSKVSSIGVVGTDADIKKYVKRGCCFLVTVGHMGNGALRAKLYHAVEKLGGIFATVISPYAHVSQDVVIGKGTIVMHGVFINAGAQISAQVILNTSCVIEHGAKVGENVHISTGAIINGDVTVEEGVFFGSNAVSKQGSTIPSKSFVKAGRVYVGGMPRRKVCFLTVVYPGCEPYLNDFIDSLKMQTYSEFDLIVVNDGLRSFDPEVQDFGGVNVVELSFGGGVAKNREVLIRYALRNGYEIAVFGDVDDYFSECRVEEAVRLLDKYDVVVNDICPVGRDAVGNGSGQGVFSQRLKNAELSLEFIKDKNVFGMSNTAVRLQKFKGHEFVLHSSLIAVDWLFFSWLLGLGATAVFSTKAKTFYRQHEANTVGVAKLSADNLGYWIKVKKIHYKQLVVLGFGWAQEYLDRLEDLEGQFINETYLHEFLHRNSGDDAQKVWWEIIEVPQ
jgi:sugar O-acyltransferase (sialic acid O-acetyltransferase NeuD family)